jgi:insertion element IS1 protein InsB
MVARFAACPDHVHVQRPVSPTEVVIRRLEADAAELWRVGGKKAHQQGRWMALEAKTRQVLALHVGNRSRATAQELGAKMPWGYRAQATCHRAHYEASQGVIPPAPHQALTKKARNTHPVERLHTTLRPRVSRLGRETLSLSNKLANHSGAITYFLCHDHLTQATALPV